MLSADAMCIDRDIAELDDDIFGVHRHAGIANGTDDAAPVRISTEERRLDKRALGDAHADRLSVSKGLRARDVDRQELRRALAIVGDLLGELLAELVERFLGDGVVFVLLGDRRIAGSAVGHDDDHVVRAHVAVDRDHVERRLDNL